MIALKTDARPFTPPWYKSGKGPVFMIRAGDVAEREMFEAELAGEHDAARVLDIEIELALESGISFLLADAPEQLEELRAMLAEEKELASANATVLERAIGLPPEERQAFIEKESRKLPDDRRQTLDEARRLIHKHWPDYRALIAQQARRQALLPLEAFRRFCTGWERLKQPYQAGPDGLVTLDAVKGVSPSDMKAAGLHAYRLLYGASTPETRKNSLAPAKSERTPRTSRSGAGSTKRGGKSRASAGGRTRG
jgi:hypothetical protein